MACFHDLDDDLICDIISRTSILDVPTLRSVCKRWERICNGAQVTEKAFLRTWGLATVDPWFSTEELLSLRPKTFVTVHRLKRGETMESLAVRYGSSDQIRVLNNLLSERALTAHTSVYVPLPETDADSLAGKHLRRVVTGALSRVLPVVCDDPALLPGVDITMKATRPSGGMRALQTRLLAEEEAVPTAAARYYLTETDGDVRAAKAMLRDDMAWEDSAEGRHMLDLYDRQRRGFLQQSCLFVEALFIIGAGCLPCCCHVLKG